mmetsp:Transcript_134095/g.286743  ORF Transcript_134095/g.286743 Transcript_134095/m.286743 type:complete len:243 (+) Transcript_134095:273-1001(+)
MVIRATPCSLGGSPRNGSTDRAIGIRCLGGDRRQRLRCRWKNRRKRGCEGRGCGALDAVVLTTIVLLIKRPDILGLAIIGFSRGLLLVSDRRRGNHDVDRRCCCGVTGAHHRHGKPKDKQNEGSKDDAKAPIGPDIGRHRDHLKLACTFANEPVIRLGLEVALSTTHERQHCSLVVASTTTTSVGATDSAGIAFHAACSSTATGTATNGTSAYGAATNGTTANVTTTPDTARRHGPGNHLNP